MVAEHRLNNHLIIDGRFYLQERTHRCFVGIKTSHHDVVVPHIHTEYRLAHIYPRAPKIPDKGGGLGSVMSLSGLKLETCAGNYQTAAKPHHAI